MFLSSISPTLRSQLFQPSSPGHQLMSTSISIWRLSRSMSRKTSFLNTYRTWKLFRTKGRDKQRRIAIIPNHLAKPAQTSQSNSNVNRPANSLISGQSLVGIPWIWHSRCLHRTMAFWTVKNFPKTTNFWISWQRWTHLSPKTSHMQGLLSSRSIHLKS